MRKSSRFIAFILLAALIVLSIGVGCEQENKQDDPKHEAAGKQAGKPTSAQLQEPSGSAADELRRFGPTKPGMKWKFRMTVTTEGVEIPLTATAENLPPTQIDGMTVDQTIFTADDMPSIDYMPSFNYKSFGIIDDSAIVAVAQERRGKLTVFKTNQRYTGLKLPLEVGSVWETTGRGPEGEPVPSTVEIVEANEVVTVVGGTYSGCLKVKQTDIIKLKGEPATIESYSWYAPDIGPVRTDLSIQVDAKEIIFASIELEKFFP